MNIKIRKIQHKNKKFFGFPDEKDGRGCGINGYKRCYGHYGEYNCDCRTRAEILNRIDRNEIKEIDDEDYQSTRE